MSQLQSDLHMRRKQSTFVETGSCFDATKRKHISKVRPGGHEALPPNTVDVSAFSYCKKTDRKTPTQFLRRGTGTGGTLRPPTRDETPPIFPNEDVAVPSSSSPNKKNSREGSKKIAFVERPNPPNTDFRRKYERGDLPVRIEHGGVHNRIAWTEPIDKLDYHTYLVLFCEGLREVEMPYAFLAEEGVYDLIQMGPHKIVPVLPQIIIPIKTALNTRDRSVIAKVLKVLQKLVQCDHGANRVGEALVPHFPKILPVLNIFIRKNDNLGDSIDYSQQKRENLGDLIMETLEAFEIHGGKEAFELIKGFVPTYESVNMKHLHQGGDFDIGIW